MTEKNVNPRMLQRARESRGLTQGELAVCLGVTQGKVSKSEAGLLSVADEYLDDVVRVLAYPKEFFYQEDAPMGIGSGCLYYRKRQSTPINVLRKINAIIGIRTMHIGKLLHGASIESESVFPQFDIDEFNGDAAVVARMLRKAWKMPEGPVSNLVRVIENAGGAICRFAFGTRKIDAISHWTAGSPPLFFLNAESPPDRTRFSLAHELAHIVMHSIPSAEMEKEADTFAAEFLMPAKSIISELKPLSIQRAAALKPYWKVSMAAIIKRAYDLGKISEPYYRKLFSTLSRLGYKTNEPHLFDDELPTVIDEIIRVHEKHHKYTTADFCKWLCLQEQEFKAIYKPSIAMRLKLVN